MKNDMTYAKSNNVKEENALVKIVDEIRDVDMRIAKIDAKLKKWDEIMHHPKHIEK